MPLLRVDFQEGFDHDDVVVSLDDRPEAPCEQVSSRLDVGYAGSLELDVDEGTHQLAIEVTTRGLQATTAVDVAGDAYVGVSVSGGGLEFMVSPEPMGYL